MAATLIVDGYNAINALPETRKYLMKGELELARKQIIAICKEYARSSGYIKDVCVIFDGDDKYRELEKMNIPPGGAEQIFSKTGDGDDQIIRTVKRYASFSRVIVASNDNYVRNMSRGYGASLMDVKDLLPREKKSSGQKQDKDESKNISRKVQNSITEEYMKHLGLDDE